MLDPPEPDTSTTETNEQPPAQPAAPRRRRAASRPAGPPSSAPDAPTIERPTEVPGSGENSSEAEVATPPEKTAKKSAIKRPAKKSREENPASEGEVVKTPRKRTAKKALAMAAEALSDEAPAPATDLEEVTQSIVEALSADMETVSDALIEEPLEAPAAEPAAEEEPTKEPTPGGEAVPEAASDTSDEGETGDGRRRRRRRGGRRRRRTTGEDASTEAEQTEEDDATEVSDTAEATSESARRRRRRRRRRGEEAAPAADDPTDTVIRVREPRRQNGDSEVSGIDGSTRMEAKRQRRREGREAGRRRTPVLSEAEFLARRESVVRKMIIRQRDDLVQIAVLEDDILVEHYVDRATHSSLIGSVYLGRVQNVLPSMEAAFVDIGRGRNGVIYAGEVDWDYFGAEGQNRKVEKVLKSGQTILVQVSKDPVGAKGARLTNHVSIPGRYIVYAPGGHLSGISRKLPEGERRRLKDILSDLVGESASVIVRTAAVGGHRTEGGHRQCAAAAVCRTRSHRTHRPRSLHRRLLRVDHFR